MIHVHDIDSLNQLIGKVKEAQATYASFSQEQVDEIFRQAALAANAKRINLAKMAVEETGMGIVEDKVIKNHFASEYIYNKYKDDKTCGVLEVDETYGTMQIAEPIGIIAGIVPTTNPTSTAIFKALIALKTRNAIIFSPHPRAKASTQEAAKIIHDAAVKAGAPVGLVTCIDEPSVPLSQHLMKHPDISIILATGGLGMVKAAYSSGKPAIGVGAGNTPAVIDETADIQMAVSSVLMSKTFDNGVVCASEQSLIVVDEVYDQVREELVNRGAYLLNKTEKKKIGEKIIIDGNMSPDIVGQTAHTIAGLADVEVDKAIKVLVAECEVAGDSEPFAHEKLSPTLGLFRAKDYEEAVEKAEALVALGGIGHTSVLYTNEQTQKERIEYYGKHLKTARILVNMPASQGAIGDLYNFKLAPSLTLGCGSWGGNSISENVGVKHLMNVKTVAARRENMLWHKLPKSVYFKPGALPVALEELVGHERAMIVTDNFLFNSGYVDRVIDVLKSKGLETQVFYDVEADPSLTTVKKGVAEMMHFRPDVIVALGGGSPMDAAKIMWVMYEHPDVRFEDIAMRFMDIRKRIFKFPKLGEKAMMVAIPTTSGTGSEVTPFAVVTDTDTGEKYPIADYELTPNMAIVDPQLVMDIPPQLTAFGGIDALTHALEAFVSVAATEYTDGQALEAACLIFKYLPSAYEKGALDPLAREKVHYGSTIAGIAFANAFLGVCHSMAHKLGAEFHLAHGLANALLISEVIRYNASDVPSKQGYFPQYRYPKAKSRYARIADHLNLGGDSLDEKVELLIQAVEDLKEKLNIPKTIKEAGVHEQAFLEKLDELAEHAFDDQCTGTNPRYPLISEIKELFKAAYYGREVYEKMDSPLKLVEAKPAKVKKPRAKKAS